MKRFALIFFILSGPALAENPAFRTYVDGCRHQIMQRSKRDFTKLASPIRDNDRAENLVDEPLKMVKNLREMERLNLKNGKALVLPWSDSYWPLSKGALGQRYNDEKLYNMDWKEAKNYVTEISPERLVAEGKWDELAPSEKYDLLLNMAEFPLTRASWAEGEGYFNQYGRVESWMGLCHGWSAAAIMTPEPKKKVTLNLANGAATFFPSDIKAFNTLLWAKGDFPTRFIGGRCNKQNPSARDNECLDNNPGTWHLAVVNQLGISKRPFIMDASSGYEVWNHPVYLYEYSYINPKTRERTTKLSEASLKRGSFRDPFEKYRSRDAETIVGVAMTVTYAVENFPSHDENQELNYSSVEYEYDLELNAQGVIVGGEWSSDQHPDFLWVPQKNSYPQSIGDSNTVSVNLERPSPQVQRAAYFNANQGLPFGPVVRELVRLSSEE